MVGRCDLLLLAAFAPELVPFSAMRSKARGGTWRVEMATVGVGLVDAGLGAARALRTSRPSVALLVGTCGAYAESGLGVLDVIVARSLRLGDPGVALGQSAFAPPMMLAAPVDGELVSQLTGFGALAADLVTTLAITTDDALAARLGAGAGVEHLEAAAVARACAMVGVRFAAVLGVANRVGCAGRQQWQRHHEAAAARVAVPVLGWLEASAPS